ncbi:hypothetical protein [Methylobacterium frigidaeris]|uniref:hypothetical protein n=1 Tax=Methylobacterium frigidaeris TaxID=2038277 RepID=UPI001054BCFD|nr:hypothetical protein [Methylobacterium frigidaeris]
MAAVDDDDAVGGKRFTETAYLLTEVVSSTDEDLTPASFARWIGVTVRLYREHDPCQAILVAEQESVHVTVHLRDAGGWTHRVSTGLDDDRAIPSAGLLCKVGDLHRDTRWQPRRARSHRTWPVDRTTPWRERRGLRYTLDACPVAAAPSRGPPAPKAACRTRP